MKDIVFELLFLLVVGGLVFVTLRVYEHRRLRSKMNQVAYFSGGPLDGVEQKLAKLPETYKYTYDQPRMVTLVEGQNPQPVKTWHEATYDHLGSGVYQYVGTQLSQTPVKYGW